MELIDKLQGDMISAMINKDTEKKSVLSFIVAEIKRVSDSKNPTDKDCIDIMVKQVQSNKDVLKQVENIDERFSSKEKLEKENEILNEYLPSYISKEEIIQIIKESDKSSIGELMGLIKKHAQSQNKILDGKMASQLVKENLQ